MVFVTLMEHKGNKSFFAEADKNKCVEDGKINECRLTLNMVVTLVQLFITHSLGLYESMTSDFTLLNTITL